LVRSALLGAAVALSFGMLTTARAGGFTASQTRADSQVAANTLDLQATLSTASLGIECAAGLPPGAECRARTGRAVIPGLGNVSQTYTWFFTVGPPNCPSDLGKPLSTTVRLIVAGKGEIHFALADGARCVDREPIRNEPQEFTITGGTGPYQGASGKGKLERNLNFDRGTEWLTGTLVVPGLEFDVIPPTLTGAASKTVRAPNGAKRVRVTYNVAATDAVDGGVPVTCLPRSGSRFSLGRTAVTCKATDKSGNTGRVSFAVTVRGR
jgi:hypothetical protein